MFREMDAHSIFIWSSAVAVVTVTDLRLSEVVRGEERGVGRFDGLAATTATTVREGRSASTKPNDRQATRSGARRSRQRAAGPDERTRRREYLASPMQLGPPVTYQSAGSPSTVCVRPGVYSRFWSPGSPGRGSGPGHTGTT